MKRNKTNKQKKLCEKSDSLSCIYPRIRYTGKPLSSNNTEIRLLTICDLFFVYACECRTMSTDFDFFKKENKIKENCGLWRCW